MAAKKEKKIVQKEAKQETQKPVVERNDLLEAQEALEAEKNKFLRLFAEFENYKKDYCCQKRKKNSTKRGKARDTRTRC
jgi:molecular chaperone GrpE (heat shock protein)